MVTGSVIHGAASENTPGSVSWMSHPSTERNASERSSPVMSPSWRLPGMTHVVVEVQRREFHRVASASSAAERRELGLVLERHA